jgi:hypothetical protein
MAASITAINNNEIRILFEIQEHSSTVDSYEPAQEIPFDGIVSSKSALHHESTTGLASFSSFSHNLFL